MQSNKENYCNVAFKVYEVMYAISEGVNSGEFSNIQKYAQDFQQ